MNVKILAQNIKNNPTDFTSEQIEKSFEDYAELRLFEYQFGLNDCFKTEAKTVKDEYVIHKEPRMIREDFEPRLPSWMPKPTAMDKLILLIRLPKDRTYDDATYSSYSLYEDVVHYVTIGDKDNMEIEVLHTPRNEISILWGLFKWTYK